MVLAAAKATQVQSEITVPCADFVTGTKLLGVGLYTLGALDSFATLGEGATDRVEVEQTTVLKVLADGVEGLELAARDGDVGVDIGVAAAEEVERGKAGVFHGFAHAASRLGGGLRLDACGHRVRATPQDVDVGDDVGVAAAEEADTGIAGLSPVLAGGRGRSRLDALGDGVRATLEDLEVGAGVYVAAAEAVSGKDEACEYEM